MELVYKNSKAVTRKIKYFSTLHYTYSSFQESYNVIPTPISSKSLYLQNWIVLAILPIL